MMKLGFTVINRVERLCGSFAQLKKRLNNSRSRGYVSILLCVSIPVLLLGVKYVVDLTSLHRAKLYRTGDEFYKRCAKAAALEVAKKWNPGLTFKLQKESILRVADSIYNKSPIYSACETDTIAHYAIPGLEVKDISVSSGKIYDPFGVSLSIIGITPEQKILQTVEYQTISSANYRALYTYGANQAFYRIIYGVKKDPRFLLKEKIKDDGTVEFISEDIFWDFYPTIYCGIGMAAITCRNEYMGTGYYDTEWGHDYSSYASTTYSSRVTQNDNKVQISVENDRIKVKTDKDICYSIPAECNVDIILAIPINGAACNKDNRDATSSIAGVPTIVDDPQLAKTISTSALQSVQNMQDMRATPIYQIAQAYKTFLRNNFEFTRGVNVGLIPYSGKFSIPPDKKVDWTCTISPFISEKFLEDQNTYPAYLRGGFLYSTIGQKNANLVNVYINNAYAESDQTDPYGIPSEVSILPKYWGVCSSGSCINGGDEVSKGVSPLTGVMCRGVNQIDSTCGNNIICIGDLLSNDDPSTSTQWRRVNNNPCYLGYANLLSMKSEKDCTSSHLLLPGINTLHQSSPYFLVELQSDVGKICDLLSVFGPFYDYQNVSNFIFLPIVWANNLFQDWTNDPQCNAMDTAQSSETEGQLSNPSKMADGRKKVLILVVNKPDYFESGELTYLGFNNDYSEVPMMESDCIRFDIDYSDTSRKFADGASYDGSIQGSKKILTFTGSVVTRDSFSGFYECKNTGNGKLTFPQKALVKIVVEPAKFTWTKQINDIPVVAESTYWRGIAYYDGIWVIINNPGGVIRSTDNGITFVSQGNPLTSIDSNWYGCLCSGNDQLITLSSQGKIATSINGITWTYQGNSLASINSNDSWYGLAWGKDRYVAIHTGGYVATSPDGVTWISQGHPLNDIDSGNWFSCTYGDGQFTSINVNGYIATSTDGTTWVSLGDSLSSIGLYWHQIYYCDGTYVAITWMDGCYTAVSRDGINWINQGQSLNSINDRWDGCMTYGNNKFLAVSNGLYTAVGDYNGTFQFTNISGNTASQTITKKDTVLYVEPSQISDTRDENGDYSITFNMSNLRLVSAEITNRPYDPSTHEYTNLRLPEMSRVVDFSKNFGGVPEYDQNLIIYGADETGNLNSNNMRYDAGLGYWTTTASTEVSTHNRFYNMGMVGDFFCLLDDIGTIPPLLLFGDNDNFGNPQTDANARYLTGLSRMFMPFGVYCYDDFSFSYFHLYRANLGGRCKAIFGGFTLPINAALYYGASGSNLHQYQWQSDSSGNLITYDPSVAAQRVTTSACQKLKSDFGDDIRIYVIKYRAQEDHKNKITGVTVPFDYSYIDECASDPNFSYEAEDEAELQSIFETISEDIKNFAGYNDAKNVEQ